MAVLSIAMLCGNTKTAVAQNYSAAQQTQIIAALKQMNRGNFEVARGMVAPYKDPLSSKIYYWMLLQDEDNAAQNFSSLQRFLRSNKDWPNRNTLIRNAERSIPANVSNANIVAWFDYYPAQTYEGLKLYLGALKATGKTDTLRSTLNKWWPDNNLKPKEQSYILANYGGFISQKTQRRRLDHLLFSKQYTNARSIGNKLGGAYPALVEARIALAEKKPDVNALINKVPVNLQTDPGLLYERIKWRRKKNMNVGAMELLHAAPDMADIQNHSDWWRERHIIIRRLLEQRNYKSAYLLAKAHRQKEGFSFAQAEFLSGWLALRYQNQPSEGLARFKNLYAGVKTPISKARAAYWAGRAAEEVASENANVWYEKAAKFQTVFYGQLAAVKLSKTGALPVPQLPANNPSQTASFEGDELLQAARLFHRAGLSDTASRFYKSFAAKHDNAAAYYYATRDTEKLQRYTDTIALAKKATDKGLFLTAQSYPTITSSLNKSIDVEWALIHAIIRQESRFNAEIKSPAGAVGLMQLMPATAKQTARKLGISHQRSWLADRPSHNVRLGNAYLKEMLQRYDGNYPMAAAAYNAGPGRVDKWIKTYGDPRTGQVDMLDWMEIVPIYETRNYMQRVTECVYIYRLRLQGRQPQSDYLRDYKSLPNLSKS